MVWYTLVSDGSSDLEGTINATSLEDMPGGVDKKVCFDDFYVL